jgi:hypothetical protein
MVCAHVAKSALVQLCRLTGQRNLKSPRKLHSGITRRTEIRSEWKLSDAIKKTQRSMPSGADNIGRLILSITSSTESSTMRAAGNTTGVIMTKSASVLDDGMRLLAMCA